MRPLYDALYNIVSSQPLRMHMPGHKGVAHDLFREIAKIDFTEIPPTGNLYTGEGPFPDAEALCAAYAGAHEASMLSCGSTLGIQTAICAAVGTGGKMILDRGCHKSVYHAMSLLDISPVYLNPDTYMGLSLPLSPEEVEMAIFRNPDAKALFLTSPSYYGIITDLRPIAEICHAHNLYLIVDQAHGAHFPTVDLPSAMEMGADLSVVSTHKTWPALGSSAILYNNSMFDKKELKSISTIFGTTSPSYPILASIDYTRDALEGDLGEHYRAAARRTDAFRKWLNGSTPFHALCQEDGLALDPCRLTIDTLRGGIPGHEADALLQQENIFVEMSDERYIVLILTCNDTLESFSRLKAALEALPARDVPPQRELPLPHLPEIRASLRFALFGKQEKVPLKDAAGQVSAQIIAPYPPGIPIIAPGEEITEKHIAYLQKKSYNIESNISVMAKKEVF